jgi:phosphatidylglycerol:prolipoprotein diacylglycerol transferase
LLSVLTIAIGLDPVLARMGFLTLTWHGLFTALALAAALVLTERSGRRAGLDEERLWSVMVWATVGGVIGARAFYYLDHPARLWAGPAEVVAVWKGGIAVYGGFVGSLTAGYIRARRLRLAPWQLLDLAAVPMLVGQAIGRLGCLINGDAWGRPSTLPWAVVYTHPGALLPLPLHGVPTHPYPLYEIGWDALVAGAVLLLGSRLYRPGDRFLLAVAGYGLGRLWLSVVRQEPVVALGLQEAQLVALLTGGLALATLVWRQSDRREGAARAEHAAAGAGGEPS